MRCIVSVPHSEMYTNDVGAAIIAEHLYNMLKENLSDVKLHRNFLDREVVDMNRPPSRMTAWRTALRQDMVGDFILIDIHGFPVSSNSDYCKDGCDIALLHTPNVTDKPLLEWYAEQIEDSGLKSGVYRSRKTDDIMIESYEQGSRFSCLAENAEEGWGKRDAKRTHHEIYADAHRTAILNFMDTFC